jgi:hypothetical protein
VNAVNVAEAADRRAMSLLLVGAVVVMMSGVAVAMALHLREMVAALRLARRCGTVLRSLPQRDPPDGSDEFYAIQIPVERENVGAAFAPKTPEELAHISAKAKLEVVHLLTAENEKTLAAFFQRLNGDWLTPLQFVKHSHEVNKYGKICVRASRKVRSPARARARARARSQACAPGC